MTTSIKLLIPVPPKFKPRILLISVNRILCTPTPLPLTPQTPLIPLISAPPHTAVINLKFCTVTAVAQAAVGY